MNLYYLAQKQDRKLSLTASVALNAYRRDGVLWRGLELAPSDEPQVRLRGATACHPFCRRPETIGWFASARRSRGVLTLAFTQPGAGIAASTARTLAMQEGLAPIVLPWSLEPPPSAQPLDLVIHVPKSSHGPVFLAIHKALERDDLLALCKGVGVEIGPGPKPQILPSAEVSVGYVEQMPSEEWRRLYGDGAGVPVEDQVWDRYVVGEAHQLPVEDGSLDFIFSSHVFEHLVNPLGHLQVWRSKLKPGGRIVAVIPDHVGSKDYLMRPSTMQEFLAEYKSGAWSLSREHYRRYAMARSMPDEGERIFREGRSIHAHYYDNGNMAELLDEAVRRFGFAGFSIRHTPNHKDFHVVVVR